MMDDEHFQALAHEILQMGKADQAMRKGEMWDASLDVKHTLRLKQIIEDIGWPTASKVGAEASHIVWLLAQHADHDRGFQRSCLMLMKTQPAEEVQARDVAYLEDRVRVGEQRPQLYGTQFHQNEQGELEPFPIEDQELVDQRRSEVGLSTLAEYTALIKSHRTAK